MSSQPLLTIDAVRDWVGDFEIGKGRPYANAAVTGCVRTGDTLKASVRGTRTRPYRVDVQVADGAVVRGYCSCPVGSVGMSQPGRCKHVAAMLLVYVESPTRFVELNTSADLDTREKPELVALVRLLLLRAPELEPLLASPLPGAAAAEIPPDFYFWQAVEVIRAVNPASDQAAREIAEGVEALVEHGHEFEQAGQAEIARAVWAGVSAALNRELSPNQREQVIEELPDFCLWALWPGEPNRPVIEPPF